MKFETASETRSIFPYRDRVDPTGNHGAANASPIYLVRLSSNLVSAWLSFSLFDWRLRTLGGISANVSHNLMANESTAEDRMQHKHAARFLF